MSTGDTLYVFHPYNIEPPATNYAALFARNQHIVLRFDPTTDEEAVFSTVMPQHYDGGGIDVYIHYSVDTAETGDVVFQSAFERIGDQQQDVDSDGFASFQCSGAVGVPGTTGLVDILSISHTSSEIDGILAGEKFRLKIRRDADNTCATDSVTANDIEVHAIEIRET
jgi:hypothetical protein